MAALYSPTAAAVVLRRRVPEVSSRSISCISSSYDARTTRRKNYLRRKILETLENPATPKLPPGEPILPVRAPLIDGINECDDVQLELNNTELVSEAGREVDDFEKSESIVSVVPGGATESFPFFKHGLWLIAAFLFQTFFVVYFFSSDNEDGKTIVEGNLKDDDSSPAELTSHGIDSTIRLQGLEMEMKIEEIRMMARKARELERTEAQIGDSNEVGDDHRTGIEEEVDSNLTLLRMKLENGKKTISRPSSSSDHIETGHKMGNQDSLFKKKHNFRGLPMDKAKGFTPKDDRNTSSDNYSPSSVDSIQSKKGFTDSRRKPKKEKEKTIKKRSSSKDDAMKSKVMNGNVASGSNGSLRSADSGYSRSRTDDDFWWLNLPYVLVIFMSSSGLEGEGGKGLYTLKSISESGGGNKSSHLIAFEDRTDATNFCYLLRSFFGEMSSFEAEVVPLPVKDLNEGIGSGSIEAIVVKKGELRMYAGQPLADAEMALRGMI